MELFELVVTAPTKDLRLLWVDILGRALVKLVGGCSAYEGVGGFTLESGVAVFEPHTKLQAFTDGCSAREVYNFMATLIRQYKENTEQECVLVVLDGEPQFLSEVPDVLPA